METHLLIEGHSMCPFETSYQSVCADSTLLELFMPISGPFEVVWTDQNGDDFDPSMPWSIESGDVTMTVFWESTELCHITNFVDINEPIGDLDFNGQVGSSDILPLLSELGCQESCAADLNGDQSVTVSDLLVLLTAIGQSCN